MRRLVRLRDTVLERTPGMQRLIRAGVARGWVPEAVWRRLQPLGVWTLHAPDGRTFRYEATRGDAIARRLIWSDLRDWEETTQPVLYDLARRARCFVDVGAFTGIYTLLACTANPALEAVAVEPNPAIVPMLSRNVRVNAFDQRVTVVAKALSARAGLGMLSVPADSTAASLLDEGTDPRATQVELVTGDELLGDRPVDLIKLDVEGHEAEVLGGLARVLARCRPPIIAECLTASAVAATAHAVTEFGYFHVYHLGPDGPRRVAVGFAPPARYANFLFSTEPLTA